MNKKINLALLVAMLAVCGSFATGTDVAAMTTAATTAITAALGAVGTILIAGLAITIAIWTYGKIKAAIRRN